MFNNQRGGVGYLGNINVLRRDLLSCINFLSLSGVTLNIMTLILLSIEQFIVNNIITITTNTTTSDVFATTLHFNGNRFYAKLAPMSNDFIVLRVHD